MYLLNTIHWKEAECYQLDKKTSSILRLKLVATSSLHLPHHIYVQFYQNKRIAPEDHSA